MSKSLRYYTAPVPKMPSGLMELMDGLARDVLKHNPTDVYEFCSDHMMKLLQIRDNSNEKVNSNVKQPKTLEQKIAIAKKIIGERATVRREAYDQNMQDLKAQSVKIVDIKTEDVNTDADAEQYIKNNVIEIVKVDLSGNTEHEIAVNNIKTNENIPLIEEKDVDSCEGTVNAGNDQVLNKEEVVITENKDESVSDVENNVMGDMLLEGIDENNTGISVITTENNANTEHSLSTNEIHALNNPVMTEDKNIEIEKVHTKNTNKTEESVPPHVLAEEQQDEDVRNQIECDEFNHVEKVEGGGESDSLNTPKPKPCQKSGVEDNTQDKTTIACKSESLDSPNKVQGDSVIYNEISSEKEIENKKEELLESDKELSLKRSVSCDNIDEKYIQEESLDRTNKISGKEPSLATDGDAGADKIINESLGSENELDHKLPSVIIDDDMDEDKKNYEKLVNEVNNTSMDLETAAITIQKVFRSFLFRNKTLSVDEATNVDINLLIEDKEPKDDKEILSGKGKERRALGSNRLDTVLQTVNEEKSLSLSTDDSSTLSSAATIIQAHVRGFLVRNKFNFNKANSSTSGFDSDGHSTTSFEIDNDGRKNKTVLNIHIVPEGGHYMSRDESMLTSIDLSVDGSPRDYTNLHPMGYDTSERRKQLKREDAVQSISPPSNNSGKQSEEFDSVKEVLEQDTEQIKQAESNNIDSNTIKTNESNEKSSAIDKDNIENVEAARDSIKLESTDSSLPSLTSDEMDVVTPFAATDSESDSKILHSGEFHDVVLPTKVSRSDTAVVRGE